MTTLVWPSKQWRLEQMGPEYGPWKLVKKFFLKSQAEKAKLKAEEENPVVTFRVIK